MQSVLWHLTFWIIFLWPKTDNYVVWRCWLVFFKKDELLLRRRKTICFFEEICLRIIFSHTEACAKMKNVSIFSPFLSIFHWLVQLNKKFIYSLYFMHFHYTVNQQDFLSLQRWYWLASRLWWYRLASFSNTWLDDVTFVPVILQLCRAVFGTHKFRQVHHGIVFVCVKIYETSIIYNFHEEP